MPIAETDPEAASRIAAVKTGLGDLGWNEGRNLRIEFRWAAGDVGRLHELAGELIRESPDVLLTNGTPAVMALAGQTSTTPIVFVNVADPVGAGFVKSFARPGGNITGFINYEGSIGGKWLETLKDIAPPLTRILIILNGGNVSYEGLLRAAQAVAPTLGVEIVTLDVSEPTRIEQGMDEFASQPGGGLIILPDFRTSVYRDRILAAASRHRLPAVYPFRLFVTSGGLASYGVDGNDLYRRGAASYVDRILRGTKAADLPVQAPTKYELVINLKTARTLGLEIPPTLLARADEVIE
jgi:putative ABC transport system substrate-binding protein